MKKILILIIALFGISATAQNFGGGIYLGMNTSQINGDNLNGYNMPGANIGVFTSYDLNERARILFELAFFQKGAREPISDTSSFNRVRLNYLEIPLLVSYKWKRLSFEAGPALDILLSSKSESQGFEFESVPPFYTYTLAGIVGVSWHFTDKFIVSFRTNNSISTIRESNVPAGTGPNAIQIVNPGQRNLSLSFALVYKLR